MDLMWIGLGLVGAAFFIGEGLKNFKNPNGRSLMDSLDSSDTDNFIKEDQIHHYIGVSKEDAKALLQEYPDIPHIRLNGNIYYPRKKVMKWMTELGDN